MMLSSPRSIVSFVLLPILLCMTPVFAASIPTPSGQAPPAIRFNESPPPPPGSPPPHAMGMPEAQIRSLGTFNAKGTGIVSVTMMKGAVTLTGKGDLTVDREAKVAFKGTPGIKANSISNLPKGKTPRNSEMSHSVIYKGFNGEARVSGAHRYDVALHGNGIVVNAHGAGSAFLMGTGSYACTKNGAADKTTGQWGAMFTPKKKQQKPGKDSNAMPPAESFHPTMVYFGDYTLGPMKGNLPPQRIPEVQIKSLGTLVASGNGMVNVMMQKGAVTIAGNGDLTISNDAKVTFKGTPGNKIEHSYGMPPGKSSSGRATGSVEYQGFNGEAQLSEEHRYNVHLQHGKDIKVNAHGAGTAFFMGTGSYTGTKNGTEGKTTGQWAAEPVPAASAPKPATPALPKPSPETHPMPPIRQGFVQFGDYSYASMPGRPMRPLNPKHPMGPMGPMPPMPPQPSQQPPAPQTQLPPPQPPPLSPAPLPPPSQPHE